MQTAINIEIITNLVSSKVLHCLVMIDFKFEKSLLLTLKLRVKIRQCK